MIDKKVFDTWWQIFHEDDEIVELRSFKNGEKEGALSGFFTDRDVAFRAADSVPDDYSLFSPFNKIHEGLRSKKTITHDRIAPGSKSTADADITLRRWLMIDLDPKRPSDISSTNEEKGYAWNMMLDVGKFMQQAGFEQPVIVDSGNGYHLYFRISDVTNTDDSLALIRGTLSVLSRLFDNDRCGIDTAVSNAARITKVVGSISSKGVNTPERPWRYSNFVYVPDEIRPTHYSLLEKVAKMLPDNDPKTKAYIPYEDREFNIDDFLSRNGIGIAKDTTYNSSRKIVLTECPFNPEHKAPDSAIFVAPSGAIGFKCLHNSCSEYTWHDVRVHYEPDSYGRLDRDRYTSKRDLYSRNPRPAPIKILPETEEKGKKWRNMQEIEWQDPRLLKYIPTGFTMVDRQIGGLALGDVSLLSGLAGSGKTSFINNIALSAMQHGYKVAVWSGELSGSRFKSWLNQAACGRNFVVKGYNGENEYYYAPKEIVSQIDEWTKDKLWLYNNDYGNHASQLVEDVTKCINEKETQLVVVDNKMALALDEWEGDKNERDAGLINWLVNLAKKSNIHIILVAHPRKELLNTLLRMESISGNSDLYNAASNVFLIHKVGQDFVNRATQFWGKDRAEDLKAKHYDVIIECVKNRSHGKSNLVEGLYYEEMTRRILNYPYEYVVYDWQPDYKPADVPPPPSELKPIVHDEVEQQTTPAPSPQEETPPVKEVIAETPINIDDLHDPLVDDFNADDMGELPFD